MENPKFNIEYGIKGEEIIKEVKEFIHLGEAMEYAQAEAINLFKATKLGQDMYHDMQDAEHSPITAFGYFIQEASEYIEFNAEEIIAKPGQIYLVSKQSSMFEHPKIQNVDLETAINLFSDIDDIGLDTETTGLDPFTCDLLLLQLGIKDFQVVFDISSYDGILPQQLKDFLHSDKTFLLQNAKFDLQILFHQGVLLKKVYDTMLAEIITTNGIPNLGKGLDALVSRHCGVTLNKDIRQDFISGEITTRGIIYGADDVKYLHDIRDKQKIRIDKYNLHKAIELDNTFVIVLAYTEYCGIKLDYDKWLAKTNYKKDLMHQYEEKLNSYVIDNNMYEFMDGMVDMFTNTMRCTVNWNSPIQIKKIFKKLGINLKTFVRGVEAESTNQNVLRPQQNEFPIIKTFLKYKEMQKDVSTYGESWKKYINPVTGRIHTDFWQLNRTGRLSSGGSGDFDAPNLQNLPADQETRACFVAETGNLLVDADYSG